MTEPCRSQPAAVAVAVSVAVTVTVALADAEAVAAAQVLPDHQPKAAEPT